jgi:hypothetical protein
LASLIWGISHSLIEALKAGGRTLYLVESNLGRARQLGKAWRANAAGKGRLDMAPSSERHDRREGF